MFKHKLSETVGLKTYIDWALLACLAGSINAGGYLACSRFVTHVTGFATLAGVDAAYGEWNGAVGILTVPVYFLIGVMTSAYFVDRRINSGKRPRYAIVMGIASVCLLIAGAGGYLGWFGIFGHEIELQRDYLFLALLCGASGLQNAALTSASGATLRTTHLTGATTDLGIGLVRAAFIPDEDPKREQELKAVRQRVGTIAAFMVGSGIGGVLFIRYGYLGFLFPLAIAVYATVIAVRDERIAKRGESEISSIRKSS